MFLGPDAEGILFCFDDDVPTAPPAREGGEMVQDMLMGETEAEG